MLLACKSPYVVSLLAAWQENANINGTFCPRQFLVMELCESSLRDEIVENPRGFEIVDIQMVAAHIFSGLDFIHR